MATQPLHTKGQTLGRTRHHQIIHYPGYPITLCCSRAIAGQDNQQRCGGFLRPQEQGHSGGQSDLAVQENDLGRLPLQMLQQGTKRIVLARKFKIGQLGKHSPQGICTGRVGRKDQYIFHRSAKAREQPCVQKYDFSTNIPSFLPEWQTSADFCRSICRSKVVFCHK